MGKKKLSFLYTGTEVVTDEFRIGVVDMHHSNENVAIRYHNPLWPFPEWDNKTRTQLTPVEQQFEEALF
jgi:hypothetical protein